VSNWATGLMHGRDHPLRRALVEELHVRRFPAIAAPARMIQIVMHTGEHRAEAVRDHALDLCGRIGAQRPAKGRDFCAHGSHLDFVWEQHTEFCIYSFICPGSFSDPFAPSVLDELPLDWIGTLPGQTVRATRIALLGRESSEPTAEMLTAFFPLQDVVCCDVFESEARIWSNFRVHEDGLGRLLILDRALHSDNDRSRLVQRLQELGNYRNMALLGLSIAQSYTNDLLSFEQGLADLARTIAQERADDERLLKELSVLSAKLAHVSAETRYRMNATRAYAHLVEDRIRCLRERRVPGFQTLSDFTERRFLPAIRTCESFAQRLDDLLERTSHASALLRTRIETSLERQSRDLLESMNKRTHVQLRLQEMLEGASVLAISYYAIGILGYLLKPFGHLPVGLDVSTLLAASTPVVVLACWRHIRRLRVLAKTAPALSEQLNNLPSP
jgi:uncharacterized membrane-anchored protein